MDRITVVAASLRTFLCTAGFPAALDGTPMATRGLPGR